MRSTDQIINFASQQQNTFRRADVMKALSLSPGSEANIAVQLNRLVSSGRLTRVGYGMYSLPQGSKPTFTYQPSEKEVGLAKQIKDKFPFVNFCVWKSSALTPFMLHIPASHIILVDAERIAMDAVFTFIQANNVGLPVLLNPDKKECERYITTDNLIIVRPLINEAPCTIVNNCPVPTLEKMLVDAIGDKELSFMQGAELYSIYNNVFEMYDINRSRLLRYASRRNRKEKVNQILKEEDL